MTHGRPRSARPLSSWCERLSNDLSRWFSLLRLRSGIACDGADVLCGSSEQGVPGIRQMSQLPTFYQSNGYRRASSSH
jgi:hypothetical protein